MKYLKASDFDVTRRFPSCISNKGTKFYVPSCSATICSHMVYLFQFHIQCRRGKVLSGNSVCILCHSGICSSVRNSFQVEKHKKAPSFLVYRYGDGVVIELNRRYGIQIRVC